MRKKLLAWFLAGAMACSMLPVDVAAAAGMPFGDGIGIEGNLQGEAGIYTSPKEELTPAEPGLLGEELTPAGPGLLGEALTPAGPGLLGEALTSAEPGNPGETPEPGESGSPGETPNPGGSESPGETPNPGEPGIPGETPNPGEPGSPGEAPNPGEPGNPGETPNPGDPGNPGETPEPGEPGNPGEVPDTEEPEGDKNPGEAPEPGQKGPNKYKPVNPGQTGGQDPAGGKAPFPNGGAPDAAGQQEGSAGGQDGSVPGVVSLYEGQGDAGSQEFLDNWDVPLDGMDIKFLEVPSDFLARAKGIDGTDPKFLLGSPGIDWDARGSQRYSSAWDIYSSNYIYNHLSARQKKFWDALDYVCNEYLTKDLNAIAYPYNWSYACPEWKVLYGQMGLTVEEARNTFIMFSYSNPQYYFLDSAALPANTDGSWVMFFYGKFANGLDRRAETNAIKAQINTMGKKIAKGKTEVEKAKIAHDLIIQNVKYDHDYKDPYYARSRYHQSAYSVFFEGYTVCAGYSKAFELLMNAAGIDTMAVTSTSHAWNLIRLNDSWYQVDCTWDDRDGAGGYEGVYTYFCRNTALITKTLDRNNFHQMEYFYAKKVPQCTLDSGATLTSIGTYKTPASKVKRPTVSTKKVSSGMQVTIKTGTPGATIYYTLDGKAPSPSSSKCYRYTKPFKVSSNVKVRAVAVQDQRWDSTLRSVKVYGKMCTVKFNAMGGKKVSSKKVHYNYKLSKPKPKRSGYKFVGWYKDKKCKKAWNFKSKVTKNMTLYAKWKRK